MQAARGSLAGYAAAATLVRLSDEGARVALTFLAVERGGGAQIGGLLVAAILVPHVAGAPVIGLLVDRSTHPSRRVAGAAAGFGIALAAAGILVGRAPSFAVVAVLLVGGCCGPAMTGALSSLLPDLVPLAALPRAFGLDSLTYNLAGIVGPSAAAVLAGLASPLVAVLVLAASAGAGALVIWWLPARTAPPSRQARPQGLLAGVRAIVTEPALAAVTGATTLAQVGAGALPVVATVAAVRAGEPAGAGLLLGAVGVGGLAGSLLWTWRPTRVERAPAIVLAGLVGAGLPLMLAAATPSLAGRALLFAVSGVADGLLFGALLVTRERHSRAELRSQVFTLGAGVKITATAAGAAIGGAISPLPTGVQLAAAGGVHLLAAGLGGLVLRRFDRPVVSTGPGEFG
ncbi:MAG: MFS transporter [Actinomycetota bacterium]|nr:MFS transporter [Actinomycetota bacterium]